ncbi:MAG TPA: PEGA domain-containing protein, partial [Saprospiraceae bacterium]|nr:PEGA domain-containing protein [Saprospiraceae bacterium]
NITIQNHLYTILIMRNNHTVKKSMALLMAVAVFFTSCSSSTLILSDPSGAKLYLNGEHVGTTPYRHRDTKIVGSTTTVKLEKEGYAPLNSSFSRDEEADVGAIIGGIFLLIPFLWTMKYKDTHNFELVAATALNENTIPDNPAINKKSVHNQVKSKTERLRELKQLLDENIITQKEFDSEKAKILNED